VSVKRSRLRTSHDEDGRRADGEQAVRGNAFRAFGESKDS